MNQLTDSALAEIHGGYVTLFMFVVAAAATAAIGALYSAHFTNIIDNWGDFKEGIGEGYKFVSN